MKSYNPFIMWYICLALCTDIFSRSTASEQNDPEVSVEPYNIGYNGSWQQFCDYDEIENDFLTYPEHDLKRIRLTVCNLQKLKAINRESLSLLAIYKYGHEMRSHIDEFLMEFMSKFSKNETSKREILLDTGPIVQDSVCYVKCSSAIAEKCIGEANPYFQMFKYLMARACIVSWLNSNLILSYIEQTCTGKWITDRIDWPSVSTSILDGTVNTYT